MDAQLSTVEELDAQPQDRVLVNEHQTAQRVGDLWYVLNLQHGYDSAALLDRSRIDV